jgi:hypothetical protein
MINPIKKKFQLVTRNATNGKIVIAKRLIMEIPYDLYKPVNSDKV